MFARVKEHVMVVMMWSGLANFAPLFLAYDLPLGKGCLAKISLSLSTSTDDVGGPGCVRFCKGRKHDCPWMCKDQVHASCPFTRRSNRSSRPPPHMRSRSEPFHHATFSRSFASLGTATPSRASSHASVHTVLAPARLRGTVPG